MGYPSPGRTPEFFACSDPCGQADQAAAGWDPCGQLNTGTKLLNGTIVTNDVMYAQNVVVNRMTLPPGTWLITAHASYTTSVDAIYAHTLMIGQREGITVRNSMFNGGGTAIPYLCSIPETTTVYTIINQSYPVVMTLESNILRAVKL